MQALTRDEPHRLAVAESRDAIGYGRARVADIAAESDEGLRHLTSAARG
jgi:hypothetical protein